MLRIRADIFLVISLFLILFINMLAFTWSLNLCCSCQLLIINMIWNCVNFKWASLQKERHCENEEKSSMKSSTCCSERLWNSQNLYEEEVYGFVRRSQIFDQMIVSLFSGVEGLSEANQIARRWWGRAWWVVKTNCHLNKILDCGIKIFMPTQKKIEITLYYMAVSHKDWELPNSRIWLAEINFDGGLDYSI